MGCRSEEPEHKKDLVVYPVLSIATLYSMIPYRSGKDKYFNIRQYKVVTLRKVCFFNNIWLLLIVPFPQ